MLYRLVSLRVVFSTEFVVDAHFQLQPVLVVVWMEVVSLAHIHHQPALVVVWMKVVFLAVVDQLLAEVQRLPDVHPSWHVQLLLLLRTCKIEIMFTTLCSKAIYE